MRLYSLGYVYTARDTMRSDAKRKELRISNRCDPMTCSHCGRLRASRQLCWNSTRMSFFSNPVNLFLLENSSLKIRRKRYWVHKINKDRTTLGEFHTLYGHLREDEERFWSYFRMSTTTFDYILSLISHRLQRQNTNFRKAITVEEKLMVTIR